MDRRPEDSNIFRRPRAVWPGPLPRPCGALFTRRRGPKPQAGTRPVPCGRWPSRHRHEGALSGRSP